MSSLTENTGSDITTRSGSGSALKEGHASSKHKVGEGAQEVEDPLAVALQRLAMLPVSDAHIDDKTEIISTLSNFYGKIIAENMSQRCQMATLSKAVDDLSDKVEDMKLSCMSGIGRAQLTETGTRSILMHARTSFCSTISTR